MCEGYQIFQNPCQRHVSQIILQCKLLEHRIDFELGRITGEQCRGTSCPHVSRRKQSLDGRGIESLGEDSMLSGLLSMVNCHGILHGKS